MATGRCGVVIFFFSCTFIGACSIQFLKQEFIRNTSLLQIWQEIPFNIIVLQAGHNRVKDHILGLTLTLARQTEFSALDLEHR